jgi:hypothetical protein
MDEDVEPVYINVYTSFFKKDLQIYALGDIRFQKPKSIKAVGYTIILMAIWSLPMLMLIGADRVLSNVVWTTIVVGPPILLGMVMSKPVFHNKPLIKDLVSIFRYVGQARKYTDFVSYDYGKDVSTNFSLWTADWDCYGQEEKDFDEPDGGLRSAKSLRRSMKHQSVRAPKQKAAKRQKPPRNHKQKSDRPLAIPLNDSARKLINDAQINHNQSDNA